VFAIIAGFDRLNQAFNDIIHQYLLDIVINFGSVWDFVPPDKYEEFKAKYLDPVATRIHIPCGSLSRHIR